jgi:hypothetical protein
MNLADGKRKRFVYLLVFSLSALITPVGARAYPPNPAVLKGNITVEFGSRALVHSVESFMPAVQREEATPPIENLSSVQVTTNKTSYSFLEPVVVTIVNGLSFPIYALTGQSYCSIVTVQRNLNGKWNPEGRCMVAGPPGWLSIAPGERTVVDVRPRLPSDQPLASNRHRVAFTFKAKSTDGTSSTVFAAEFLIISAAPIPSTNNFTTISRPNVQIADTQEG